ncbi:glucokinase [Siccirubricoccus sp. KC 17139]|uniref:Glucokinase n=1 Tax=Siccirubricoccus soli TaxID=2899147 RepID=A0ABT1D0H5_9PROT|nr:glucokinase [Siccirubricoccus soli]MCO6415413.1 glucokinase [Siccirubricoccus soli]MCP2681545.1 glucokinase [Siccirubricoccus soli]
MTTLLADIGGTHARFALLQGSEATPPVTYKLDEFPDIATAIRQYLAKQSQPEAAVLAVAGPVVENRVTLTNRGWVVDGAALSTLLGIPRIRIVNDFAALAWALPHFGPEDLLLLGGTAGEPGEPMAVLGPGTGLGVAAFLPPDRVLASEGGHASLAAQALEEAAVIATVRAEHGHVSAERLISGQGIEALYAALGGEKGTSAPEVTARALAGGDAISGKTLALFCALLGSFAGDVALMFGARGGVFIGGGICPRFPDVLARSEFRARFEAKGRFQAWLAPVPTWLILRPDPAMLGLAALARQHG